MNLLIVDDHAINRKLLRMRLETEGHRVLEAAHGIEALEILERESVDGVVSDILMPGMDGFQLCLEIRKRKELARLPFIFYTGTFNSPQDRELARTVGVDQYLTKPSTVREILGALDQAMQKTRDRIAVPAMQHDETYVLKQYNEALVRKLGERNLELEDTLRQLQAAHLDLHESEGRLRLFVEHAPAAIAMVDNEMRYLAVSRRWLADYRLGVRDIIGRSHYDVFPETPERWKEIHRRCLAGAVEKCEEDPFPRADGSMDWVRWEIHPWRKAGGETGGIILFSELITERKLQQQKIEGQTRIRALSSGINAAIVHTANRQELLDEACRIAVEHGGFGIAWIGKYDPATLEVTPLAWAGVGPEQFTRKSTVRPDMSEGQGAMGRAIREREPVFINDLTLNPAVGGQRREEAIRRGYRSLIALPLIVSGEVFGNLTLFTKNLNFFNDEEVGLLTELAGNLSFALEHIERKDKFARLSRIEAVMGSISGLIVRVRDRDELFREACRIAVDKGRFRMSLIGIVDPGTMKVVPVASAGKDEELLASIKGILSSSENAPKTMVARAIREKKAVVSNDSQGDPGVIFGKKYAESGVRSMAILPLIVSDEAVGVLALYAEETGFFDDEEMKLLTELTGNIAFAIDHIAKQERLDYLAYYDALTGLANRTLFLERVAQSIRGADSGGHKVALFLLDLDRFKNINDSLGRLAGDALLRQVAAWMTRNVGDANLLARVDADHFAVMLPEVKQEGDVARLIEKSLDAFMAHPFRLRDAGFRITAKVGVALFPDDGADADTLFRNAEAALKKAKSSGERYLFHTKKMTEAVATRLTLENQLREALDTGEFVLHYQPKVDLASGAICGLEALIRWQKPGADLVAPGVFIPLLEETGLILGVGKWALAQSLAQRGEWTERGCEVPRIAVNVSAIQLQHKDFSDVVIGALQARGANPDALELEVTESLLMQDVQESIHTLSVLRALGIQIAMDDFGTGYSSLSYLARLPINSLKIDRSFITEMVNSPQDMSIVTTIIALAHSLNLRVVAEGVETAAQSELLKLLKCDEAQGYFFSKPLPAAAIEPLLRRLELETREPQPV